MEVVIVGAGSTAHLAISILQHDHNLAIAGCVDVKWPDQRRTMIKVPVIGDHTVLEDLYKRGVRGALVAVSDNRIREQHFYTLQKIGYELVSAVHQSAVIGSGVRLGRGLCIAEGCVISAEVSIGDNVILEAGAVIGSHAEIGPHVYLGNGSVVGSAGVVGKNCFIDVGVSIARRIVVGKNNYVPAGTSIRENVPDRLSIDETEKG